MGLRENLGIVLLGLRGQGIAPASRAQPVIQAGEKRVTRSRFASASAEVALLTLRDLVVRHLWTHECVWYREQLVLLVVLTEGDAMYHLRKRQR